MKLATFTRNIFSQIQTYEIYRNYTKTLHKKIKKKEITNAHIVQRDARKI